MTGKPRIEPKFPRHSLFERLLLNSFESAKPYTKPTYMIMLKWLYKMRYLQSQNYVHPKIISNLSPFTKVKLKWSILRGSRFKVHFCLKFWKNRGSSRNFHRVPFSGDSKIITQNYTIIPFSSLIHTTYTKTWNLT